ncbi:MAG: hypothetical protein JO296_04750 [Pseudonocardiales bacterium]|jgi:hypothetical protein|nr:hypothetical protein [Pseudonocardiales bacterium]MBV9649434.1 hypothetical protein [Pseudonocardiales bacterium]
MGEQPCRDRLSRRSLPAASGALAAGTLLPGVAFTERPGTGTEPSGEQTRTVTGTLRPDVSDWSRCSRWVRAEVRRPVPTATTPDAMVALTNPVFLTTP